MTNHKMLTTCIAGAAFVMALTAARTASAGTAAPICVDARDVTIRRRAVSPADLTYSPYWLSVTNGSAWASRIDLVTDPDTPNAMTNTLVTGDAGTESAYNWTPSPAAQPFCRLLHWTLEGGAPTGLPIVCDIVIGKTSPAGVAFAVDTRANSLQEVVDRDGLVSLSYSPLWTFSGTSVWIERVRRLESAGPGTTNEVAQTDVNVEGTYPLATDHLPSGYFTLRHVTLDASAQQVGETLTADFVIQRPKGTRIRVR